MNPSGWMLAQTGEGLRRNPGALNRSPLDEIAEHFHSGSMIPLEWIAIAAGLIIVAITAISLYRWHRTRHLRSNPPMVFHRVAREAGLSWSQQVLLWRIARQQSLPTPLTLMLSPATLDHHARLYVAHHSPRGGSAVLDRVAKIHRKLFVE